MVSERLQHQRYELKYQVAEAKALRIRDFVQVHLDVDEYSALQNGLSYPTLSLYLDSDALDTHWHTINGNRNGSSFGCGITTTNPTRRSSSKRNGAKTM